MEGCPEVTNRHVEYLQANGHDVKTIEQAKELIATFHPESQAAFFDSAARWDGKAIAANGSGGAVSPKEPVQLKSFIASYWLGGQHGRKVSDEKITATSFEAAEEAIIAKHKGHTVSDLVIRFE